MEYTCEKCGFVATWTAEKQPEHCPMCQSRKFFQTPVRSLRQQRLPGD